MGIKLTFLFCALIFFGPTSVYANVGPLRIAGQNLIPLNQEVARSAETEAIAMQSEEVVMEIRLLPEQIEKFYPDRDAYIRSRAEGKVSATFYLANETQDPIEDFVMGFPFLTAGPLLAGNTLIEVQHLGELTDLQVFVDGQEIKHSRQMTSVDEGEAAEPWAVWAVDFARRGEKNFRREVRVSYRVLSSDLSYTEPLEIPKGIDARLVNSASFYYVLHTGRGWKGNIGSSVIRVKVPDEIPLVQKEFLGCDAAECVPVRAVWKISPKTFKVDPQNRELVWEFVDWEPNDQAQAGDFGGLLTENDGPDILVQFMYPETIKTFEENYALKDEKPLDETTALVVKKTDSKFSNSSVGFLTTFAIIVLISICSGAVMVYFLKKKKKTPFQNI